ncbi:type II toxin-antitoxin system HicA family toxin [uncultured Bosea sp.]|uniref:type II toxin-antitoxin system HicA family toxin n=1 Tax=uncultured Bosea sp. TaxID=211457 RepID=UPI00263A72B4|nr:type II toxin-antitoxin system HicA family toxin [uncultured Bosea sp.]
MNNFAPSVRKLLAEAGYERLRSGKGDHEIWHHSESGKRVSVDSSIKSRHTANGILKQAGLPKAF